MLSARKKTRRSPLWHHAILAARTTPPLPKKAWLQAKLGYGQCMSKCRTVKIGKDLRPFGRTQGYVAKTQHVVDQTTWSADFPVKSDVQING